MKGNRLKTLGFALAGGLALLFAGCGQQAGTGGGGGGGGTGNVTSVGITLPVAGALQGRVNIGVNVNEGAQVKTIVAKVDGQQVNQITVQGLRPQALQYTISINTAQLDPTTNQPKFLNGTHTLTVEVTDVNNNTKSASTQVTFLNNDYVRGLIVSQTDNPKAPVTVGNTKWYGNGDVYVTVDIVNYSGATYTISGSASSFTLSASGGAGGSLSSTPITVSGATASPVTGQPQLKFAKTSNPSASGSVTVQFGSSGPSVTFDLDNAPPTGVPALQLKRFFEKDYASPSGAYASGSLMRGSGATDGGVGVVVYTAKFVATTGTEQYTFTLPAPLSGVVSKAYNVTVTAQDALGNTSSTPGSPTTVTVDDRTFSLVAPAYTTTYNAGQNLSFTSDPSISGSASGTVTYVLALKDGNSYLPLISASSSVASTFNNVFAVKGASYAIVAVDQAGNFATLPLNITVNQINSDTQAPTVTIDGGLTYSSTLQITGKASDNVPGNGYLVGYVETGQAGGNTFYRYVGQNGFLSYPGSPPTYTYTTSPVSYSLPSPAEAAPNYTATLGVKVVGVDAAYNLGITSGQIQGQ
ncbi:hypothetical protein [Thermus scotoductus]|uniref:hypothetical protein n=1 Tax=Thermus scotoductus TaxID=37636 RepID=UPI0015625218|nr:hypothetical protein [Thermus scotoductus]